MIVHRPVPDIPGVIDEDIQTAIAIQGKLNQLIAKLPICQVSGSCKTINFSGGFFGHILVKIIDNNLRTTARKLKGVGFPKASTCTGNYSNFSFKLSVRRPSSRQAPWK